ncbi:MAG: hypothetical protein EA415_00780 [Sphaerobacteraceae bacterium]|nr:MAG: hypothetical protein EA415_00780 [Sphaerobacteraceae bacterium]
MSDEKNTDKLPEKPEEETPAPERTADTPREEIAERDEQPREGESPEQPPREVLPDPDEADVAPGPPFRQVPNKTGHGGLPWEELRKGTPLLEGQSPEQRLWDDRGVSKPQQIDYPKKTWDELPEETEPAEEKISSS